MISDVLDRFADSMATTLDGASAAAIVGRLMEKFADNKIVIRQQNLKVMKKLISSLSPAVVLPPLLTYTSHDNSHIREQAVNVVIQTLLASPSQPTELYRKAMSAMSAALDDVKPKVQSVALEACAVLREAAGPAAFDALLRECGVSDEKVARIDERVRQGREALPALSNDGLVEFTVQPGLPPKTAGAMPSRASSAPRMIGGGGGAGGGGDDFSELQEMTAGGRRIATSRAAQRSLPWDVGAMGAPRSGSASRVSDRSSVSSLEGVLEEGNGGNGRGRGRGAPRIDKFDGAVPPGPFSDPFPAGRHDPNGGGSGPGSPVREIEAGEAAKIAMWLPGAAGGNEPPPTAPPGRVPPRGSGGGSGRDSPFSINGVGISADDGAAARQSLTLLKARSRGPAAAPNAPFAADGAPRAVSAAGGKGPQVRLPFEAQPRSSSAPHKRTPSGEYGGQRGGGPSVDDRLEAALGGSGEYGGAGRPGSLLGSNAPSNRSSRSSLRTCTCAADAVSQPMPPPPLDDRNGPAGRRRPHEMRAARAAAAGGGGGGGGGGVGGYCNFEAQCTERVL